MLRWSELQEAMDMPDPSFPIKVSLSSRFTKGKVMFRHHWHQQLELLYFVSGEARIECNSVPLDVRAGDLVVINSHDIHYGVSASDKLHYYIVIADLSLLHSLCADASETKYIAPIVRNDIVFQHLIRSNHAANDCVMELVRELEAKQYGYELSVKSHLYRLLTLMLRCYPVAAEQSHAYRLRMRNLERLHAVFDYIEEHYSESLTVQQLADMTGLSRYYFSRLFKSLTGRTVTEYINVIRINKSEHLLRTTQMSVTEVALATGYNDIYYFSRLFKQLKHIAPSQTRNHSAG